MRKLLPPLLVALLILAMVAATLITPWPRYGWPVRVVGIAVLVAGVILTSRHAALFGKVGTNIKTFDDPDTLVLDGAFGWTRNPMYLGFVAILFGTALALGSVVALAGSIAFFVAADRWYIPFEERRMTATFGADYARYQLRVRRWVGRTQARDWDQTAATHKIGEHTP